MDKSKLIQIILKDLEELKYLTEEVTDIEGDATLIIDLAHSKAKLLCQEIELLRELSVPTKTVAEDDEEALLDEEEREITDDEFSEPELEILNFEEARHSFEEEEEEFEPALEEEEEKVEEELEPEEEIITEELEEESFNESEIELIQENELEVEEDEQVLEEEDIDEEEEEIVYQEDEEEELEDDEKIVYQEEDEEEVSLEIDEETEAEIEEEIDIPDPKSIEFTELGNDPNTEYREINIDDHDDDDIETIQFSPLSGEADRPVMHEIPKPENQEKTVIGEKFQKERSLNDAMGENKLNDSKLTNGPISNLRAAIGLNDRFLFTREIFDNNAEKYNTVIENLDKLETIQQAVEYLKANLSLQKNETSMKFVDLLKRRFTK